jgi:hypothetical protein
MGDQIDRVAGRNRGRRKTTLPSASIFGAGAGSSIAIFEMT